ncbi:hypothetical protein IDJ77_08400 [Mucilaginibacter sp. ZT4R22]|uniref:Uncharacterized protein n=1 Tax=Mucilaginibacter pankratovii TaxID=2772110 RepID=A0ABR7WNE2_9SPHI|nr:hypothetical protein [Mucilaginibacter pankratovii]MBD1363830.1 hypothetical protein [Mucilaginibacter pankratovii]
MTLIIAFIFYKIGRKRVIGGFNSFMYGLLLWPIGIFIVLNSRRLDDEEANATLLKEFSGN